MHDLSNEASAMLDDARSEHDPSDADRRRVKGAMIARLGAAAVISSSTTLAVASGSGAAAGGFLGAAKVAAVVAVLSLTAGTVTWHSVHSTRARTPAPAAAPRAAPAIPQTPTRSTSASPCPAEASSLDALSVPSAAPLQAPPAKANPPLSHPSTARTAPLAHPADGLSEQVNVLAAARTELREAHPELALSLLDGRAALFEHSALREEFLAARGLALRDLGRQSEAQAAAARLMQEVPRSGLARKIEASPVGETEK